MQIDLTVTPDTPFNTMTNRYGVRWVAVNDVTGRQQDIKQGMFDPNPAPGTPAINLFNLIRVAPRENTSYRAFVFGGPQVPPPGYVEFKINVSKVPNTGIRKSIFTCNKTTIDLLAEIGGDPGGVWVPALSSGGNTFTVGTDTFGAYNYTFPKNGPCPEISTTVTIKDCSNEDNDNDGIPDSVDKDDDNDGIPDTLENFCTVTQLVPSRFSLEEDFGVGGPQMNPNLNPILTYNVNIPQDISNDGEYNVATATYLRDSEGPGSGLFITTDKNRIPFSDGDGTLNGRYLAINPRTGAFPNTVYIYRQPDIPVIPGVQSRLSFETTNLNTDNGPQTSPSLRIEIVGKSNTGGPDFVRTVLTGNIVVEDVWEEKNFIDFVARADVSVVTLSVYNEQTTQGNGNDFGIDNIFLSTLECDFDFDGVPNALDLDSDNDGIYDIVETGNADKDADGDGRYDGVVDAEGVITGLVQGTLINSDSDSNADYLDIDSDNDGIVDNIEAQSTANYRAPSTIDGNVDGVDDAYNGLANRLVPVTTIGGGTPDYLNTNTDADCLEDSIEAYDTDRNGTIDGTEKGTSTSDTDSDGLLDSYDEITLGRLARYTNANNDGQTPDTFLNNHNPETNEKDWREPFADIIINPVAIIDCTNTTDLFDEIVTLFTNASAFAPITGVWTTPGTKDLGGTPARLGTLDPSDSSFIDGDYVYTVPPFNGTSCPEQKITLKVTIDNACKCPTITPPTEVSTGPYITCINATTLPQLEVSSSTNTDIVVRWFAEDKTTILESNNVVYTPSNSDIKVGTTTFNAQFYDTVQKCESDFIEIQVEGTAAPNAGTDPLNPLLICASSTPVATISESDLFAQLTGADTGGEWTSPSLVVLGTTFNTAPEAGDYTYSVMLNGCEDQSQVAVELISVPTFTFGATLCSMNKLSYSVDFTFAGNIADYTVTSNVGTVTRTATGGKIEDVPSAIDIEVTITSTNLSTCSLAVPTFTGVDCSCPIIDIPMVDSSNTRAICEGDPIPTLSVSVGAGLTANWLMADGTPIATAQNTVSFTPTNSAPDNYVFNVVAEGADGCTSDPVSVMFTIIETPKIVVPTNNRGCESDFTLPNLSVGNYFTGSGGTGTQMNAGEAIKASQRLFIYATNTSGGTTCSAEEVYNITIDMLPTPTLPILDPMYCEMTTVPDFTGLNQKYFTEEKGKGLEVQPGTEIRETTTLYLRETNGECGKDLEVVINIFNPILGVTLADIPSVCLDDAGDIIGAPPIIEAPANLLPSQYDFQWLFDGVAIAGLTDSSIEASALGQYQLEYKPKGLTCSNTSNIVLLREKEKAVITGLQKEGRRVTVIAEGEELEYSINDGAFQTSNVFDRVPFGDFNVEVRNDCSGDTKSDFLFGFPEFFTPNQDGDNDVWNVKGVSTKTIEISVFDRYGNLMAIFTPIDEGWDGRFQNIDMPGDDYWYYAVAVSGEEFRGHFSLIR